MRSQSPPVPPTGHRQIARSPALAPTTYSLFWSAGALALNTVAQPPRPTARNRSKQKLAIRMESFRGERADRYHVLCSARKGLHSVGPWLAHVPAIDESALRSRMGTRTRCRASEAMSAACERNEVSRRRGSPSSRNSRPLAWPSSSVGGPTSPRRRCANSRTRWALILSSLSASRAVGRPARRPAHSEPRRRPRARRLLARPPASERLAERRPEPARPPPLRARHHPGCGCRSRSARSRRR